MMYLTYEEFTDYGGTLDETAFNQYEFKCRKMIDARTVMRVTKMAVVPEAVKRCMYELIRQEIIYENNVGSLVEVSATSPSGAGKLVSSFSTDGYQETYANGSYDPGTYIMTIRKALDEVEQQLIGDFLAYERDDKGVLLLYRGVYE